MKLNRTFHALALTLLSVVCASCNSATEPSAQLLRVRNVGAVPVGAFRVAFPEGSIEFGDIAAGAVTEYRPTGGVYRYASYRYSSDGKVRLQLVDDFVGASPIDGKRFTYNVELIRRVNDSLWIGLRSITRDR